MPLFAFTVRYLLCVKFVHHTLCNYMHCTMRIIISQSFFYVVPKYGWPFFSIVSHKVCTEYIILFCEAYRDCIAYTNEQSFHIKRSSKYYVRQYTSKLTLKFYHRNKVHLVQYMATLISLCCTIYYFLLFKLQYLYTWYHSENISSTDMKLQFNDFYQKLYHQIRFK